MLLRAIAALIEALPRIFDWGLAPGGLGLLLLAFDRRTRMVATRGLIAVAVLSMSLLSIPAIELAYIAWRFGRIAFSLLVGLGATQALAFLATIFSGISFRPLDLGFMIATALGSSFAAAALSRDRIGTA